MEFRYFKPKKFGTVSKLDKEKISQVVGEKFISHVVSNVEQGELKFAPTTFSAYASYYWLLCWL